MARRLPGSLAAVLLAAVALSPAAADDPPAVEAPKQEKNDPYPPAFRERVNKAVDAGVANILSHQKEDGSWPARKELADYPLGVVALQTLACLAGGTPGNDPRIERAFGYMRTLPLAKTYSVGVLLMAIHAKYAGGEDAFGAKDRYGADEVKDPCLTRMTPEDREWMRKGVDFLVKNQQDGHWRYPEKGVDLSNSQYALLGLWAASRCGLKIPPEVWITALEWLLATQERTGPEARLLVNEVRGDYRVTWTELARARGFRYRPEEPVTGAMTTAGMAGLAICQDELWASRRFTPEHRARTRKGIRDAMAWMQENFDVAKNPGLPSGGWHHYYLYGLERAGMLSRSRFMGRYDWYLEGAEHLLGRQDADGSWTSEHELLDTAFAVLFLKRATNRTRNPAITPSEPAPAAPHGR
jgi:hypothetical protein